MEQATVKAVNEVRREHGRAALVASDTLAGIARSHSRDMATRGFFAHRSPEGRRVDDRAEAIGLGFRRLGENLQMNRGMADPVDAAVRSWLRSRGHRKALLTQHYRETGPK